jgi:AAA ATPase domain
MPTLLGRRRECAALDELIASVRAGPSRALVLRGEAGVGKSALLGYVLRSASGCTVARAAGVEAEVELAFAGLHQLCAPFVDRLDRLPERSATRSPSRSVAAVATPRTVFSSAWPP